MNPEKLRELLQQVQSGAASVDEAVAALKTLPYEDLGFANVDHHRYLRQGIPEVIFCQNKTVTEICAICERICAASAPVLATRVHPSALAELQERIPQAVFYERSHCFTVGQPPQEGVGNVTVICAGTSDLPVAEEAAITARFTGSRVTQLSDVGVAGIHRLLGRLELIRQANALIVVAGMEGALASVVGGLVDIPIVAVPTSVGYGASLNGISALLTMLNSCSAGVTVVNIDNGFGAGYAASQINKRICRAYEAQQSCPKNAQA